MQSTRKGLFRSAALILLLLSALASPARAHKDFGLGLIAGDPSGLSGKVWMDDKHAIDFAVGTFGYYLGNRYAGVNVHADYLWHYFGVFGRPSSEPYHRMPLYVGAGAVISTPNTAAGARAVFGWSYIFPQPFDVFIELAPTLVVAPYTGFGIDSGLGGRFYF